MYHMGVHNIFSIWSAKYYFAKSRNYGALHYELFFVIVSRFPPLFLSILLIALLQNLVKSMGSSMGLTDADGGFTLSPNFKIQKKKKKKIAQNTYMFYDLSKYKFSHANARLSLVYHKNHWICHSRVYVVILPSTNVFP